MTAPDVPVDSLTVSVLGGTGAQGRGLARRFAAAGLSVVIGSRNAERANKPALAVATANLISINRRHQVHSGLRVTEL